MKKLLAIWLVVLTGATACYQATNDTSQNATNMFTINQIKEAHAKVKTGVDFPLYVQELKNIGVVSYDNYVADGKTIYFGKGDFQLTGDAKYPAMDVAETGSEEELGHALSIHQQGQTDYPTFCRQAAGAGVEKWTVHLTEMTCTYYDKAGHKMVIEEIPLPAVK